MGCRVWLAAVLLTMFAWAPGYGEGTPDFGSKFTALRHDAELRSVAPGHCPLDPPDYVNFLRNESVDDLMYTPDLVAAQWQKELDAELARAKGSLTPYAEALIVVPLAIDHEVSVPEQYLDTLRRVYADRALGDSARRSAMTTMIVLGDQSAIEDSVADYKAAKSWPEKEELLHAYQNSTWIGRDNHIWLLERKVLLDNPGLPSTRERIEWCKFLKRERDPSCFPALLGLFNAYAQMSEAEYKFEESHFDQGYADVVAAFARTGGGPAIPLLRKNYENARAGFAEACLAEGLWLGDPEAAKFLIRQVPPSAIAVGTKRPKDLREEERRHYFESLKHLSRVQQILEQGVLPTFDVAEVESGAKPMPQDFAAAWSRFYEGVMKNRIELIARSQGQGVVFQVVRNSDE